MLDIIASDATLPLQSPRRGPRHHRWRCLNRSSLKAMLQQVSFGNQRRSDLADWRYPAGGHARVILGHCPIAAGAGTAAVWQPH
ncbi:hypothetical protein ACFQU2_13425 [Siccirubricoccus deserti]